MLQFDVHTGRPYNRLNKLCGTGAVHYGYPSRLFIDDPESADGTLGKMKLGTMSI